MATTSIHPITQTVDLSVAYIMSDKKESMLKDDIADSIRYIMNDKTGEVTYLTLTSTLNCVNLSNPAEDFKAWIHRFGQREVLYGNSRTKDGKPILAWHLVQSFEGEEIDPITANEIGRKLAEEMFGNFPVVISTHTNTGNIHNHIEFCAWDLNGTKWHQCNENYQRIRECSDRLCDEYGLSVLEATRKQKLIRWVDEDGTVRYYEPTDRKNELIRQREAGELTSDDVNSYRNTIPYEISEAKKLTNAEMVKQAIDDLLPHAVSYEHLLSMLREMGFVVKDKKKNGEWLAHITFTPPTASKGVRDYMIDKETGYYTRENLTAIIDEQNEERNQNERASSNLHIPYYEEYVYGEVDVQGINEDYRADVTEDGEVKIVQRGEVERTIIRDVKKTDLELYGLYDTSTLDRLIAEQREERKLNRMPRKREEILIRQIQEGFDNLRFMERKQVYSYVQINEVVKGLWGQYNSCLSEIQEAQKMISKLENVAKAPYVLVDVNQRMQQGENDPAYMLEKYPQDVKLLRSCMETINKYNVSDEKGLKSLEATIQKYRERIDSLRASLAMFSNELSAYDRCVATLDRIDRDNGGINAKILMEYKSITNSKNAGQGDAKNAESSTEKRKQKEQDR